MLRMLRAGLTLIFKDKTFFFDIFLLNQFNKLCRNENDFMTCIHADHARIIKTPETAGQTTFGGAYFVSYPKFLYFEMLGDAGLINRQEDEYKDLVADDIQRVAREMFAEANCSELVYIKTESGS
jgi:hypothetical protein